MANGSTTLARIQGQGLVETAPVGVTEMQSAGFSPAGALQKGLSPDAAKMAGTPPAKVNAIRMAMQDVGSKRLSALREMAAPQVQATTKQEQIANIAKQSSVLGRLDETMSSYISAQLTAAFNQSILKAGNTDARLKANVYIGDTTKQNALTTAVGNINSGKGTDADVKTVNDALAAVNATGRVSLAGDTGATTNAQIIANNLFENLTPEQMQKAFGDAVAKANTSTSIGAFLESSDADTFAKGQGLATEGMENPSDALKALLSSIVPDEAKLSSMKLGELTDAIQTWRQENFKDVAEYQKTLTDPSASMAQRQLALENLRRLGQVGVLAADVKVGDLDAQMRDGDTVNIDGQQFEISSFFTEPEKLAELKGWLDKPDTAPASLRAWIEGNRDAIQNKVNELNPDLQKLSDTVKANQETIKLPDNVQLDSATAEYFFGDLTKPTIASKVIPDKYKLLQDVTTGPAMITLLNRLKTIGNGLDGKQMFNNLSVDQLKNIVATNSVERYVSSAIMQKQAKDFSAQSIDESNFAGSFRVLMENLRMDDAGTSLSRMANRDLSEFASIFQQAGLGDLIVGGKLNINTIKAKLKEFSDGDTNSLISGTGINTLKEYLNTKVLGGIRNALAQPQIKKVPGSNKERDELFRKEKNERLPKDILAEKEAERNKVGGENHQNYLDYNETLRWAIKKKPDMPTRRKFESSTEYEARFKEYNDTMTKINNAIRNFSSVKAKFDESSARFDRINNDWNSYRDNLPQHEKDYRDKFNDWFDQYTANLNKDNEAIQSRYTRLSNIIGGMG